jgi:putative hydrolase
MKNGLIDLHTHTLLSDGLYLPMEMARRAEIRGYSVLALTDHVDASNLERVVPALVRAVDWINRLGKGLTVIPGAEITHAPPGAIGSLAAAARREGAVLVVAHGETLSEPVAPGTNRAALEAGVDILAHPGLISRGDFQLARKKGILLELSGRAGHSLANGHVVSMWRRVGGRLVINSDGHQASDLFTPGTYRKVGRGAGLSPAEVSALYWQTVEFTRLLCRKSDRVKS